MEEIANIVMNNSLGVASFIALIYFMKTTINKTNQTLTEINKSLITIQTNMITMGERLADLETITKKGGNEK